MKLWSSKKIRKWLRLIHRDLGYFFVGITIIYAVSGIVLNHKKRNEDPAYRTDSHVVQLAVNMTPKQLEAYWQNNLAEYPLNKILPEGSRYSLYLKGGLGNYNLENGKLEFETFEKKQWVYFINKLHYNSKKGWTLMADIFAIAMIIFAISGIFMTPGKKGIAGRGKWLVVLGILIPFLFFL